MDLKETNWDNVNIGKKWNRTVTQAWMELSSKSRNVNEKKIKGKSMLRNSNVNVNNKRDNWKLLLKRKHSSELLSKYDS
jgi:hypothetical protein